MTKRNTGANQWVLECCVLLLAGALVLASCACSGSVEPYHLRMRVIGGEYAPDTVLVNGNPIELTRIEEVKTKHLDFVDHWYDDVVSESQNVIVEWTEGEDVFRAELLFDPSRRPKPGYIAIWTNRWLEGHELLQADHFSYLLLGGIEFRSLTRNNVSIPEAKAARVVNIPTP